MSEKTESCNYDAMLSILSGVQEQIKFADSKAGFIALFHTILFGFIATQVDALSKVSGSDRNIAFWIWAVILFAYAVSTIVAVILSVRCVMPRLGQAEKGRWWHFTHIVSGYGKDHERYCKDVIALKEEDCAKEIGRQIVINSGIADCKHKLIRCAAFWTIGAVILWAMTMAATVFINRKEISHLRLPGEQNAMLQWTTQRAEASQKSASKTRTGSSTAEKPEVEQV